MENVEVNPTTTCERVFIFAASEEHAEQVSEPLLEWAESIACLISKEGDDPRPELENIVGEVASTNVSTVLIDFLWGSSSKAWAMLAEKRLVRLREELSGNHIPASLSLVSSLRTMQRSRPYLIIIFMIEDPTVALTQEILRCGADWVWPHISGNKIAGLVPRLRTALDANVSGLEKPRILVVENSRSTCQRIAAELEDVCDLDFVGSEKPGNSFDISPQEAVDRFKAESYDFVIVDLALSEQAEKTAREKLLSSEDSRLATFYESQEQSGQLVMKRIWGGLEVISEITLLSSDVSIIAMSVYLSEPVALGMMNILLSSEARRRVSMLEKDDSSFADLRDLVKKEWSERPVSS